MTQLKVLWQIDGISEHPLSYYTIPETVHYPSITQHS